jgi:hypothetical protein
VIRRPFSLLLPSLAFPAAKKVSSTFRMSWSSRLLKFTTFWPWTNSSVLCMTIGLLWGASRPVMMASRPGAGRTDGSVAPLLLIVMELAEGNLIKIDHPAPDAARGPAGPARMAHLGRANSLKTPWKRSNL